MTGVNKAKTCICPFMWRTGLNHIVTASCQHFWFDISPTKTRGLVSYKGKIRTVTWLVLHVLFFGLQMLVSS